MTTYKLPKVQKELLETAFPKSKRNKKPEKLQLANGTTRSARIKNLLEQKEQLIEKMEAHEKVRLHRMKKSLLKGKLVLVGDGLYETDKCNDCDEHHRVATITTESRRARKDCPHKTILSKTPTPTSSSPTSRQSSNCVMVPNKTDPFEPNAVKAEAQYSLETLQSVEADSELETYYKETEQLSREFYRDMLNQEERALLERLSYEKKLLKETMKKHKKLDLDESKRQLDEQNKIKQEKKKLEQIKKRRLALETVVKALDEIEVPIKSLPSMPSQEHVGILRYNQSSCSRKTVRISEDVDSERHTTMSSHISYMTYASSYEPNSSCSSYITDDSQVSLEERSKVSLDEEENSSDPQKSTSTSDESSRSVLKPKEEFVSIVRTDPNSSTSQDSNNGTTNSAPVVLMTSPKEDTGKSGVEKHDLPVVKEISGESFNEELINEVEEKYDVASEILVEVSDEKVNDNVIRETTEHEEEQDNCEAHVPVDSNSIKENSGPNDVMKTPETNDISIDQQEQKQLALSIPVIVITNATPELPSLYCDSSETVPTTTLEEDLLIISKNVVQDALNRASIQYEQEEQELIPSEQISDGVNTIEKNVSVEQIPTAPTAEPEVDSITPKLSQIEDSIHDSISEKDEEDPDATDFYVNETTTKGDKGLLTIDSTRESVGVEESVGTVTAKALAHNVQEVAFLACQEAWTDHSVTETTVAEASSEECLAATAMKLAQSALTNAQAGLVTEETSPTIIRNQYSSLRKIFSIGRKSNSDTAMPAKSFNKSPSTSSAKSSYTSLKKIFSWPSTKSSKSTSKGDNIAKTTLKTEIFSKKEPEDSKISGSSSFK